MTKEAEQSEASAIWAAVGNVKDPCFIDGGEPNHGTKHFRAGAKVYVIDAFWGTLDSVTLIGQHRKSRRFICIALKAKHVENLRVKLVYSPAVRRLAENHFGTRPLPTREDAERLCGLTNWPN